MTDDLALLRHVLTSDTADPSSVTAEDAAAEIAWMRGDES